MITSLPDLKYFLEVSRTKNISRAAERLGITQPTLTQAVRRLENSIGTELLIRSKKGVELTHAGLRFCSQAQDLLNQWEALKSITRASVEEVSGVLKVGLHASVALYTLPLFLPDFLQKNPLLEIQLVHALSRHVTDDVIHLRIDIGVVINPTPHPDLVIIKLAEDTVSVFGSKQKSDILIYDPNLIQAQFLIRKLKKSKMNYTRHIHTSSLELAAKLSAKQMGHALLPQRVAHNLSKIHGAPEFKDEIAVIYRIENKARKSIAAFTEGVKKIF